MYKNITLKLIIFYFKSEVYNIGNLDYLKENCKNLLNFPANAVLKNFILNSFLKDVNLKFRNHIFLD